ncbi:MAG: hypothetical protein U5R48_06200 [Gammaproteobacteria bacterium]|nr:hypothetical protein [Gammaproteobacteria bacterium]
MLYPLTDRICPTRVVGLGFLLNGVTGVGYGAVAVMPGEGDLHCRRELLE